jgi:excisionase family DNA binding protein
MNTFTFDSLPEAVSVIQNKLNQLEQLIRSQSQPKTDSWFDIDELCQYLPDKPKKATVYTWVRERRIPNHKQKQGKKLAFLKSEIDTWIKQGRRKTVNEIQAEADYHLSNPKKKG